MSHSFKALPEQLQVLYVPLTTKACLNSDTRINLQSNTKYMMSDGVDQPEDQYEQVIIDIIFHN